MSFFPQILNILCALIIISLVSVYKGGGGGVKVKSAYEPYGPYQVVLISSFCSMKRLGVFLIPPGWDASPSSIKFTGTQL